MIRVTVERIPFGDEGLREQLAQYTIANDGTGTADVGNYIVRTPEGNQYRLRKHRRKDGWKPLLARVFAWIASMEREPVISA